MSKQYVILIHEADWSAEQVAQADWEAMWAQHGAFSAAVAAAGGKVVGGDALEPPAAGFRVDGFGSGTPVFTDGPFGETKEIVSGFYEVEVPDDADIRSLCALCPTTGWVEVYPVMALPGQ